MLFQPRIIMALRSTPPGGLWLVLLLTAGSAMAGQVGADPRGNDVERELVQIAERRSFASTHDVRTGILPAASAHVLQYELREGVSYALLSVCATDCQGVRLILRDQGGRQIDEDRPSRRAAMVSVTPRWTGTFRLHLTVESCREEACAWAAGAYTRTQQDR